MKIKDLTKEEAVTKLTEQLLQREQAKQQQLQEREQQPPLERDEEYLALVRTTLQILATQRSETEESLLRRIVLRFFSPSSQTSSALSEGANSVKLNKINYNETIPDEYICPLTMTIMTDPVRVKQHPNQRFERTWILAHLKHHTDNPLTREPLNASNLEPDSALKTEIDAFVEDAVTSHNKLCTLPRVN